MQISWIIICAPVLALAAVVRERKFVTLAFLRSEGRFRQFFETQPECCYMISPGGIVLDVNPAACEALGYTKEELVGKAVSIIYAPESHSKMRDLLEKWRNTGRLESEEIVVLTRDGERRVVLVNAGSVMDAEGNLLHSTTVHVDITERKRAEEAVSTVNQRLIEAQEKERTRIARELHDDFSQRMALLQIRLEQLGQGNTAGFSSNARQQLDSISEIASEISSNIHDLSHQLHPSKLDTLGLVASVRSLCREFSEQHKLQVQFVHEDIPGPIPKDVTLCLFRIVQEALRNVVKHSGASEAAVELSGQGDRIDLCISDAGVGFETGSAKGAAGLGLISMRERLRLVGGDIVIESELLHGTRIHAHVPLPASKPSVTSEEKAYKAGA